MRYLLIVLLLATAPALNAQTEDDMTMQKNFLILHTTKSYDAALKTARGAASSLACPLNLRSLKPDKADGLTFSRAECDSNGWDYPCYVARGRYDDGTYVSIERSDAYDGFRKGYYIVIAASGDRQSEDLKNALTKVRPRYKDAYLKATRVYMGCMH